MRSGFAPLLAAVWLPACTQPVGVAPSLAPRSAERIDPRLPVGTPVAATVVDPALAARLGELLAQARAGDAAFRQAASAAERLIAAAGPRESESWIAAQQAVSVAVAARAPTTRALADIDAIAASAIARQGGIAPADLAAIEAAAAQAGEIARAQAARVDAMQARLGR